MNVVVGSPTFIAGVRGGREVGDSPWPGLTTDGPATCPGQGGGSARPPDVGVIVHCQVHAGHRRLRARESRGTSRTWTVVLPSPLSLIRRTLVLRWSVCFTVSRRGFANSAAVRMSRSPDHQCQGLAAKPVVEHAVPTPGSWLLGHWLLVRPNPPILGVSVVQG